MDALEQACQTGDAEATAALLEQPTLLRNWLWQTIANSDPWTGLEGLLIDLAAARDNATRLLILECLESTLAYLTAVAKAINTAGLAPLAEAIDTHNWHWLIRGAYGALIGRHLGAVPRRVAGPMELAAIALVHAWEQVRLDHMGCILPLGMMVGSIQLLNPLLNWLLGPPGELGWVPMALFLGWLLWAIFTMETHFTAPQTLRFRLRAALVYFSLLGGGLLAAVLTRIL